MTITKNNPPGRHTKFTADFMTEFVGRIHI